jgi:hypothetical protein
MLNRSRVVRTRARSITETAWAAAIERQGVSVQVESPAESESTRCTNVTLPVKAIDMLSRPCSRLAVTVSARELSHHSLPENRNERRRRARDARSHEYDVARTPREAAVSRTDVLRSSHTCGLVGLDSKTSLCWIERSQASYDRVQPRVPSPLNIEPGKGTSADRTAMERSRSCVSTALNTPRDQMCA